MKKNEDPIPVIPKQCMNCGSKEVYKRSPGGSWLCYDHTAKQHRDFTHNMLDYILEHSEADHKEAWEYAMNYEKDKVKWPDDNRQELTPEQEQKLLDEINVKEIHKHYEKMMEQNSE